MKFTPGVYFPCLLERKDLTYPRFFGHVCKDLLGCQTGEEVLFCLLISWLRSLDLHLKDEHLHDKITVKIIAAGKEERQEINIHPDKE